MVKRGKDFILGIFALAVAVATIYFIVAQVPVIGHPKDYTNYSGIVVFNCTTGIDNSTNATLYYNESGGQISTFSSVYRLGVGYNTSANSSVINVTVNTALFNDSSTYNITCVIRNDTSGGLTAGIANSSFRKNITIDNTPPKVTDMSMLNYSATGGNYSDRVILNVSANDSAWQVMSARVDTMMGVESVYFNITYPNGTQLAGNYTKAVANAKTYFNATINITGFVDGYYNVTVWANDTFTNLPNGSTFSVGSNMNNTQYFRIYKDRNTAPKVTNFVNTGNNGKYRGTIILNVSATDANVQSVYYNITNVTGQTQFNWTKATLQGGQNFVATYYNVTLNTSGFADGDYNITVWANDTFNNLNSTEKIKITIDNTAPSITLASSSSTSADTIVIDITLNAGASGMNKSCSSSRTAATVSGTGANQVLTETSLSCGTSYSYTITCNDAAGNSGSKTESFSTLTCGTESGSSSGGGGSSSTLKTAFFPTESQVETGYTASVQENKQIKVPVTPTPTGTVIEYHYVAVKSVTASSAVIRVASTPQEKTMNVGETWKVDVNGDSYYDLSVKLNSVSNKKADITVTAIYEQVPTTTTPSTSPITGQATGEETAAGEEAATGTGDGSSTWIWVIVIIVVIVVVWYIISRKKRR